VLAGACRELGAGSVLGWTRPRGSPSQEEITMGELHGIVRFTFHEGKVEEFKRLSAECMEIVRTKEPGTLQYDTYFNADESEAMVLERFRDAEALLQHGANMAHLMESIMATGDVSGELLGVLNAELRANLDGGPVRLFTPYQLL
jgi:quinol monooxygenase YgiN